MLGVYDEEHTVLLCNYFLYLGHSSWVVLGIAVSECKYVTIVTIAYNTSCYNKIDYFKFIVIFYIGLTTCVILMQHSLAATFFGQYQGKYFINILVLYYWLVLDVCLIMKLQGENKHMLCLYSVF